MDITVQAEKDSSENKIFIFGLMMSVIVMVVIYICPFYQAYNVSSNKLLEVSINWKGKASIHFAYNTIIKTTGDESIYKIISNVKQENYGSIIIVNYDTYCGQNFKISFIDDNNRVIDINFVSGFLGNDSMIIIDHDSPRYLSGERINYNPPITLLPSILLNSFR